MAVGVWQSIFHKRGLFCFFSFLSLDVDYVYPGQS